MLVHFMIHIAVLLVLLVFRPVPSCAISSSPVGVNYGLLGDNLPAPESVLPLLRSVNVGRVRLYDAEPRILAAFANTGVELVVGLPDRCIPKVCDPDAALAWVRANIQPHIPATKIAALTVGNEVLTSNDTASMRSLLPAMQSLHAALETLGLDRQILVSTAHNLAVLGPSYPPSAAAFRRELLPYICPLLDFHAKTGSPLLVNAYPYFAYRDEPDGVTLNYALFQPNPGVVDPGTGLRYTNMLHAQVDAVYAAINAAGVKGIEVRVSETGWPSAGDADEAGATAENAAKYNGNLMKMVAEGKGTPARPGIVLRVYVFALFNENLKPGPKSERNYGLFKPDGTPAYALGITPIPDNSTTQGGGGGGIGGSVSGGWSGDTTDGSSGSGYYSISAAAEEWVWLRLRGAQAVVAASLVLLLVFM